MVRNNSNKKSYRDSRSYKDARRASGFRATRKWCKGRQQGFTSLVDVILRIAKYPTPVNLSYFWNFGSLAAIFLIIQIVSGLVLAMWYVPHVDHAFASIDFIMRETSYGWLARYTHSNGASFFFLFVYLHMARAIYFGSYVYPRHRVWYTGMVIFLLMIVTAFLGYILPWGQMSFWAATVITNLVSVIPVIGKSILIFLWGGLSVEQPTLTRIYALHFVLPFVIVCFVIFHVILLHSCGSNNPLGIRISDYAPFHPYFIYKDVYGYLMVSFIFSGVVCFFPNYLGHPDNWIPADPSVTPPHIVPEWYFLPFYGILRSVPDKVLGVIFLVLAIILLCVLPLLHVPMFRSGYFRPVFEWFVFFFFLAWIMIGWTASRPIAFPYYQMCQFFTLYYFFFFLVILPFVSLVELKSYELLILDYKENVRTGKVLPMILQDPKPSCVIVTLQAGKVDLSRIARVNEIKVHILVYTSVALNSYYEVFEYTSYRSDIKHEEGWSFDSKCSDVRFEGWSDVQIIVSNGTDLSTTSVVDSIDSRICNVEYSIEEVENFKVFVQSYRYHLHQAGVEFSQFGLPEEELELFLQAYYELYIISGVVILGSRAQV